MNRFEYLMAKHRILDLMNEIDQEKNAGMIGRVARSAAKGAKKAVRRSEKWRIAELDRDLRLKISREERAARSREASAQRAAQASESRSQRTWQTRQRNSELDRMEQAQKGQGKARLIQAAAGATGAAGVGGAIYGTRKLFDAREKKLAYEAMIKKNPSLKKKDIEASVVSYFDALWDLNPTLAKNPIVAGTFIQSQVNLGMGIPPQLAIEMLKTKKPTTLEEMKTIFGGQVLRSMIGG